MIWINENSNINNFCFCIQITFLAIKFNSDSKILSFSHHSWFIHISSKLGSAFSMNLRSKRINLIQFCCSNFLADFIQRINIKAFIISSLQEFNVFSKIIKLHLSWYYFLNQTFSSGSLITHIKTDTFRRVESCFMDMQNWSE